MGSDAKKTCLDCKHYTDSIGSKGYCKFYRHNIESADVVCSKFEVKNIQQTHNVIENKNFFNNERYKQPLNRGLYLSGFLGCVIFSVIFVLFGMVIGITVSSFSSVSVTHKVIFISAVSVVILSVTAMLYMLVLKFLSMRFVVSVASLLSIILMLIFYDTAWSGFNDFVLQLIQIVFRQP